MTTEQGSAGAPLDEPSVDLSSHRTAMSFERTRMSADRTLMSIMRTSFSLIGFGFTVFQFFRHLVEMDPNATKEHAARNFGVALVMIGIVLLALGIWKHIGFMTRLRKDRDRLQHAHLLHHAPPMEYSITLLIALCLLLLGIVAIIGMVTRSGPLN